MRPFLRRSRFFTRKTRSLAARSAFEHDFENGERSKSPCVRRVQESTDGVGFGGGEIFDYDTADAAGIRYLAASAALSILGTSSVAGAYLRTQGGSLTRDVTYPIILRGLSKHTVHREQLLSLP